MNHKYFLHLIVCLVLCVISRLAAVLDTGIIGPTADEETDVGKACVSLVWNQSQDSELVHSDSLSSLNAPCWFECPCVIELLPSLVILFLRGNPQPF